MKKTEKKHIAVNYCATPGIIALFCDMSAGKTRLRD